MSWRCFGRLTVATFAEIFLTDHLIDSRWQGGIPNFSPKLDVFDEEKWCVPEQPKQIEHPCEETNREDMPGWRRAKIEADVNVGVGRRHGCSGNQDQPRESRGDERGK